MLSNVSQALIGGTADNVTYDVGDQNASYLGNITSMALKPKSAAEEYWE